MLLALFLFFSTSSSLLRMELCEKDNIPKKQTVVGLLENLIVYNTYQVPGTKYDFGKQRTSACSWAISSDCRYVSYEPNTAPAFPASTRILPFDIPVYLLHRVLRI